MTAQNIMRVLVAAVAFGAAASCLATVHVVPGDFADLATALASDSVVSGDTVRVSAGTHVFGGHAADPTFSFDTLVSVRKGVTIAGADDAGAVVLDCNGAGGIVLDDPAARLEGVTITNFSNTVAAPALYVQQGVASNVVVTGAKSCTTETPNQFVFAYMNALVVDCVIRDFKTTSWQSGKQVVRLEGGIFRRSTLSGLNCLRMGIVATTGPSAGYSNVHGRIEGCTIENNYCKYAVVMLSSQHSSINGSDMSDTIVRNNSADSPGSGTLACGVAMSVFSSLTRCQIVGNSANAGKCPVVACAGWTTHKISNCLIAGNRLKSGSAVSVPGNGTVLNMDNCTIYGNTATAAGIDVGISGKGTTAKPNILNLRNTIVYGNTSDGVAADLVSGEGVTLNATYCCWPGGTSGTGNISTDPLLDAPELGRYKLSYSSPCLDVGTELADNDKDVIGEFRPQDGSDCGMAKTDIGCYEMPPNTIVLAAELTVSAGEAIDPCSVTQTVRVTGTRAENLSYSWRTVRVTPNGTTTNTVATAEPQLVTTLGPGEYSFACTVTNGQVPPDEATDEKKDFLSVGVGTVYYGKDAGVGAWPYDTAEKATGDFALAMESAGRRIVFLPGTYDAFTHTTSATSGADCLLEVAKGVTIGGAAGTNDVVFDCAKAGGIVLAHAGAGLVNCTIRNFSRTGGAAAPALYAGADSSVSNVFVDGEGASDTLALDGWVFVGKNAAMRGSTIASIFNTSGEWTDARAVVKAVGGGIFDSTVRNCTSRQQTMRAVADGTQRARVERCVIRDNVAIWTGGLVVSGAELVDTVIFGNTGRTGAFVSYDSSWTRCRVIGNAGGGNASLGAVGVFGNFQTSAFTNCLVTANVSSECAILKFFGQNSIDNFVNCTLASNVVTAAGGDSGLFSEKTDSCALTVVNSIMSDNYLVDAQSNLAATPGGTTAIGYSCYREATEGADGNTAKSPRFRSVTKSDFHLRSSSPCAFSGSVLGWTADDIDLDGAPRLWKSSVAMGCYLACPKGVMFLLR